MQKSAGSYMLSKPAVRVNTPEEIVIASTTTWFTPVMGGALFILLGIALLAYSWRSWGFVSAMAFGLAIFFLFSTPYKSKVLVSRATQKIEFTADYILHFPRKIQVSRPVSEVVQVNSRLVSIYKYHTIDVLLKDGVKVSMNFEKARDAAGQVEKSINEICQTCQDASAEAEQVGSTPSAQAEPLVEQAGRASAHAEMLHDLRSWTISQFVLAALQFVSAGGFSPWGVVLLAAGLVSIFIRESAMYLIYAVTIALAGISNLAMAGAIGWKLFSVLQFWWAFQLVKKYQQYSRIETRINLEAAGSAGETYPLRAARIFPWVALGLGVVSLLLFGCGFITSVIFAMAEKTYRVTWIMLYYNTALVLSVSGLTVGAASLIARYPRKPAAIVGTVTALMTVAIIIAINLIG